MSETEEAFNKITQALKLWVELRHPNQGLSKVKFQVESKGTWEEPSYNVSVVVDVYGDIQVGVADETAPADDTMEPQHLEAMLVDPDVLTGSVQAGLDEVLILVLSHLEEQGKTYSEGIGKINNTLGNLGFKSSV